MICLIVAQKVWKHRNTAWFRDFEKPPSADVAEYCFCGAPKCRTQGAKNSHDIAKARH